MLVQFILFTALLGFIHGQTCDFVNGQYILVTDAVPFNLAADACSPYKATFVSVPSEAVQFNAIADLLAACGYLASNVYVDNYAPCAVATVTAAPPAETQLSVGPRRAGCDEKLGVICALPSTLSTSITVITTETTTLSTVIITVPSTEISTSSSIITVAASTVTSLTIVTFSNIFISRITSTITIPTQTITVVQTTSTATSVIADSSTETVSVETTESVTDTIMISETILSTDTETIRSTVCPA